MKDSYSFDIDREGLDLQFDRHRQAYMNIFGKLGVSNRTSAVAIARQLELLT